MKWLDNLVLKRAQKISRRGGDYVSIDEAPYEPMAIQGATLNLNKLGIQKQKMSAKIDIRREQTLNFSQWSFRTFTW